MSTFSASRQGNAVPYLHVMVDVHGAADLLQAAIGVLEAGAPLLQVRAKGLSDRTWFELITQIARACHGRQALCIANDRTDIGPVTSHDGVHAGARDLPAPTARVLRDLDGDGRLIGAAIGAVWRSPDPCGNRRSARSVVRRDRG